MSYKNTLFVPLIAALCLVGTASANAVAPPGADTSIQGVWLNPSRSVAVRTEACGPNLCGRIVWASSQARADAQDGGVTSLIGTQLLQNYHREGRSWHGTVFVPDMGRSFDSHIVTLSPAQMKVSGCVLGGMICRSQVWTRMGAAPA